MIHTLTLALLPRPALLAAVCTGPLTGALVLRDGPAVYRPRHPERTTFYRLLDDHFDAYRHAHEERYEPRSGPLRPVVITSVEAFLDCGLLHNGFARLRCPTCKGEHLLAFSCQTRNFCPSCQAKRSALFAEKLSEEILAPVPHRHYVFTIPKALRGLFERERRLLGLLSRCAYAAIKKSFRAVLSHPDVLPGCVASLQTFGSYAANFHPHVHALVSEGAFSPEGEFLRLPTLDTDARCELFRRLVLDALHRAQRLSEAFHASLLNWTHSGFSVHAEQLLFPEETQRTEHIARYLTRPPIRLDALQEFTDHQVTVRTPLDPKTGATSRTLDILDWIHAITNQIPDRGQHLNRYYGWYACRTRGRINARTSPTTTPTDIPAEDEGEPAFTTARRASWVRLLRKLLEVDPLLCPRCHCEMQIVAVITEPSTIDQILNHLSSGRGHDPFEPRAPPSPLAETG